LATEIDSRIALPNASQLRLPGMPFSIPARRRSRSQGADGSRSVSTFRNDSDTVATFECRFDHIMRNVSAGDIDAALEIYGTSDCLLIDVYNEFYPKGSLSVTDRIPDDSCIAPEDHGCPVSRRRFPNGCFAVDQTLLFALGRDTTWEPSAPENCGAAADCGDGICAPDESCGTCSFDCVCQN
jgi:hypothetical protein